MSCPENGNDEIITIATFVEREKQLLDQFERDCKEHTHDRSIESWLDTYSDWVNLVGET